MRQATAPCPPPPACTRATESCFFLKISTFSKTLLLKISTNLQTVKRIGRTKQKVAKGRMRTVDRMLPASDMVDRMLPASDIRKAIEKSSGNFFFEIKKVMSLILRHISFAIYQYQQQIMISNIIHKIKSKRTVETKEYNYFSSLITSQSDIKYQKLSSSSVFYFCTVKINKTQLRTISNTNRRRKGKKRQNDQTL